MLYFSGFIRGLNIKNIDKILNALDKNLIIFIQLHKKFIAEIFFIFFLYKNY